MKLRALLACVMTCIAWPRLGLAAPNCSKVRVLFEQADPQSRAVQGLVGAALTKSGRQDVLVDPDLTLTFKEQGLCYRVTLAWWDGPTVDFGSLCAPAGVGSVDRTVPPSLDAWQRNLVAPLLLRLDDVGKSRWDATIERSDRSGSVQSGEKVDLSTRVQPLTASSESLRCLAHGAEVVVTQGGCSLSANDASPLIKFGDVAHALTRYAHWTGGGVPLALGESLQVKSGKPAPLGLKLDDDATGRLVTFACARSAQESITIELQADGAIVQPPSQHGTSWSGELVRKEDHGVVWAKLSLPGSDVQSIALTLEPVWYERLWAWIVALFAANWVTVEGVKALIKKLLTRKADRRAPSVAP